MLEFSLKIFYGGFWSFVIVYFQQNKSAKNLNVDITSYYVKEMKQTPILSNLYFQWYIIIREVHISFLNDQVYFYWLPTKLVHLSLTWKIAEPCDIFKFLRNNNRKWLMVVNLEKSFSMENCSMVRKILTILYTCEKKVYYVFLFLKVSL